MKYELTSDFELLFHKFDFLLIFFVSNQSYKYSLIIFFSNYPKKFKTIESLKVCSPQQSPTYNNILIIDIILVILTLGKIGHILLTHEM